MQRMKAIFVTLFYSACLQKKSRGTEMARNNFFTCIFIAIFTACPWFSIPSWDLAKPIFRSEKYKTNERTKENFGEKQTFLVEINVSQPVDAIHLKFKRDFLFLFGQTASWMRLKRVSIAFQFKRSKNIQNSQKIYCLTVHVPSCINFVYLCVSNFSYAHNVYIVTCARECALSLSLSLCPCVWMNVK